jgi:peroxiredoxin Q/BCP
MRAGDHVEDFTAQDHNGVDITLSTLLQAGPVVLYFYPKAMTPG